MTTDYSHVDSAHVLEPFDGYAELRATCPLHAEPDHDPPFYVLSRFQDIVDVLKQRSWRLLPGDRRARLGR